MNLVLSILELMVRLVALILRSSWFAFHIHGIRRVSYLICLITGLHLLSALILGLFLNSDLVLSPLYSAPALTGSVILLILSALFPEAIKLAQKYPESSFDRETVRHGEDSGILQLVFHILAIAIVFGGISIWSSQQKRVTLRERICLEITTQIQPDWKEKGAIALDWSEKLLKRDLRAELPCLDNQDQPR